MPLECVSRSSEFGAEDHLEDGPPPGGGPVFQLLCDIFYGGFLKNAKRVSITKSCQVYQDTGDPDAFIDAMFDES